MVLALVLAVMIGVVLGALGSGGSILALPVLVYAAGIPPHEAVAMSLGIVGAISLLGSYLHYRQGNYHLKAMLIVGLSGAAGAYAGSAGTHLVSGPVLMLMFSAIMAAAGIAMFRRRPEGQRTGGCRVAPCAAIGLVIGGLTGFLGVGGGFLIVPALILLAGLEVKQAIGASLGIIALNSFAGLAGQIRWVSLDLLPVLQFLAAAALGMMGGVWLAGRLPQDALRKVFASALILMALVIAVLNANALIPIVDRGT